MADVIPCVLWHCGGEECGIAENIQYILACGYKDCLALAYADAVDVGISPKTDYDDE